MLQREMLAWETHQRYLVLLASMDLPGYVVVQ